MSGRVERAPAAKANTYRPGDIEPPLPLTPERLELIKSYAENVLRGAEGSPASQIAHRFAPRAQEALSGDTSLGCPYAIDRASVGDTQANRSSRRCRISSKPYTRRFLARPDRPPMVKARAASAYGKPHAFGRVRDYAPCPLSA